MSRRSACLKAKVYFSISLLINVGTLSFNLLICCGGFFFVLGRQTRKREKITIKKENEPLGQTLENGEEQGTLEGLSEPTPLLPLESSS